MPQQAPACPLCGAYVADAAAHVSWHTRRNDLEGWRPGALLDELTGGAEAPTAKLPPIQETVLRRPPAPEVRELRGAELLRALADELARDEDPDVDPGDVL